MENYEAGENIRASYSGSRFVKWAKQQKAFTQKQTQKQSAESKAKPYKWMTIDETYQQRTNCANCGITMHGRYTCAACGSEINILNGLAWDEATAKEAQRYMQLKTEKKVEVFDPYATGQAGNRSLEKANESGTLFIVGFFLSCTVFGAVIGIPMMLVGAVMAIITRELKPIGSSVPGKPIHR